MLLCPRKGITLDENVISLALQQFQNRTVSPNNIDEFLHNGVTFRSIDQFNMICDCSDYYKYKYCKHIIALKNK